MKLIIYYQKNFVAYFDRLTVNFLWIISIFFDYYINIIWLKERLVCIIKMKY